MAPARVKKEDLTKLIRDIVDFPKPGIIFKDITPLLKDPAAFKKTIDLFAANYRKQKIDYVVAIEARGFIFAAALAVKLGAGFVPVRKKGKLPYKTKNVSYELEYGIDTLEIHQDALPAKSNVLIIDDVLATGGTINAVIKLVKQFKVNIVGVAFLMELGFLKGRQKILRGRKLDIFSLITY